MILQQLRDDSSEVRLNVISRLDLLVDVIGIEKLSASLLPAIVNLAADRQWRVRQTIIDYMPELSAHLVYVCRSFDLLTWNREEHFSMTS